MQGSIHQIPQQRHGNQPHLFVVVLEFSGNKDCLVVPAFSAEGHAVNQVIEARLKEGHRIDQIAVTLDNTQFVQFLPPHTPKLAHWLVSDMDRLSIAEVQRHPLVGTMNAEGLKRIAVGLLNFAPATCRLSANVVKKLRKLAEESP